MSSAKSIMASGLMAGGRQLGISYRQERYFIWTKHEPALILQELL